MNLLRYAGVYLLISLLIPVVLWMIEESTGSSVAGSGLWVVPILGAAMIEGQYFVRTAGAAPTKGESWRFARRGTGIVLLVSTGFVLVYGLLVDPEVLEIAQSLLSDTTGLIIIACVLALVLLLTLPLNRFFFWMGARNEMKMIEKRAKS